MKSYADSWGGGHFFDKDIPIEERRKIKILELGCGSCANLWMLAREGFDVYGCDISENGISVALSVLEGWGVNAKLSVCNMMETPYEDAFFDVVIDVFSSNCLCREEYKTLLKEIKRITLPGARFFSYFPSKKSDVFIRSTPEGRIDDDTLNGIKDKAAPFFGCDFPFRFMSQEDVYELFAEVGFEVSRMERNGRTYNNGKEYFELLVFEAVNVKHTSSHR